MNIIDHSTIEFVQSATGCLDVRLASGEVVRNVACAPLFPLSDPDHYVAVMRKKDSDYEEIGILGDLGALPPAQAKLVRDDIEFRYFVPEVTDIKKVTTKNGTDTVIVVTDRGEKTFTIRDRKESVELTARGGIFLTDTDKCRYRISKPQALGEKASAQLEKLMP